MSDEIDIGEGHAIRYFGWYPDRRLNPQWAHLPDVEKAGCTVAHKTPAGEPCEGCIHFDVPGARELWPKNSLWQVESWEPLTVSPSLLCHCGDHGFIRQGKWVRA